MLLFNLINAEPSKNPRKVVAASSCGCATPSGVTFAGCAHAVYYAIMQENPPTPFSSLKLEALHEQIIRGEVSRDEARMQIVKRAKDFTAIMRTTNQLSIAGKPAISFTHEDQERLAQLISLHEEDALTVLDTIPPHS